jgi:GDPmannose 4,6-dehydratase
MKICEAAVAASRGATDPFLIGDPEAEKEFNFAGDVADALWRLIQQDMISECVIGSGKAYPVRRWLELCYSHVGLNWEDHVKADSSYRSPYRKLVSHPAKLRSLGWKPSISIEELAAIMMEEALRKGCGPV